MTTTCRRCKRDITDNEEEKERFVKCGNCNQFTPKGSNSKKVKGGKNRMADKKTKAATTKVSKPEKEAKVKKPLIGETREANAKKIHEYIVKELGVTKDEVKPTVSRLYSLLAKNKI
jgi:DNA-directed RNA polymerase subunit RPC12/RpoP